MERRKEREKMNELTKTTLLNVEQLKQLQQRFLQYSDNSPKTMETYAIALKQFWNYLKENNIKNPTREDIIDYKNSIKERLEPTTVNGYLIAVKSFFKWLEYEGLYKNITENIKTLNAPKVFLKRGLTKEEVERLVNSCEDIRERVFITLSISCALRSSEISNITINDFYQDGDVIMLKVMNKGGNGYKQGIVKIDNRIYILIQEYIQEYNITNYLFTSTSNNNKGGKVNNITLRRWFSAICERANINMEKVSLHSVRHSGISLLVESGRDLHEVQQFSRHKSLNTLLTYINEIDLKRNNMTTQLGDVMFLNTTKGVM